MPPEIVMPVEDMVDASLVGLDQGELVTILGLHNGDEWTRLRPYAAVCCHSLALPSPRSATGIKREGRHNCLSRPLAGVFVVENVEGIGPAAAIRTQLKLPRLLYRSGRQRELEEQKEDRQKNDRNGHKK
jgi:hypothetical protein